MNPPRTLIFKFCSYFPRNLSILGFQSHNTEFRIYKIPSDIFLCLSNGDIGIYYFQKNGDKLYMAWENDHVTLYLDANLTLTFSSSLSEHIIICTFSFINEKISYEIGSHISLPFEKLYMIWYLMKRMCAKRRPYCFICFIRETVRLLTKQTVLFEQKTRWRSGCFIHNRSSTMFQILQTPSREDEAEEWFEQ